MKNFYIAIVSHGHDSFLIENKELCDISLLNNVHVCIKDNLGSESLKVFCKNVGFEYISLPLGIGFGDNNNEIFKHCISNGMQDDDWFLVINPDVKIDISNFTNLINELEYESNNLLTVNLFKDESLTSYENSLRYFPNWLGIFFLILRKPLNPSYNKKFVKNREQVEWASGAFLIFKSILYKELGGFDSQYFMYFEDVDICFRSRKQQQQPVVFYKNIHAVHKGAYANRNVFSKHFRWYLMSLFRFLWNKNKNL
ncbi:glycosyltransferase family 2 protein [Colwellia sp. MB02u-6]|uniref:glycosyltransferase family 2 protein n=1 Tax=Colwellia sp. MB02u-6 TaxID=2759824 RepID=UPI0015F599CB|nr:glycosyltransferase family 2 protein [Colwellia sp. MB02u-6]MBA6326402.1 glycosyltransferase family 2 protein [Colwellia sp. MB02u-6]